MPPRYPGPPNGNESKFVRQLRQHVREIVSELHAGRPGTGQRNPSGEIPRREFDLSPRVSFTGRFPTGLKYASDYAVTILAGTVYTPDGSVDISETDVALPSAGSNLYVFLQADYTPGTAPTGTEITLENNTSFPGFRPSANQWNLLLGVLTEVDASAGTWEWVPHWQGGDWFLGLAPYLSLVHDSSGRTTLVNDEAMPDAWDMYGKDDSAKGWIPTTEISLIAVEGTGGVPLRYNEVDDVLEAKISTCRVFDFQEASTYTQISDFSGVTQPPDDPGLTNYAAQFTAANSEYFSLARNTDVSPGDIDFTVGIWVYLDSTPPSGYRFFGIWEYSSGNNREWTFSVSSSLGVAFTVDGAGSGGAGGQQTTVSGGSSLTTGTWYFIVAYHDATNNEIGIKINNGSWSTASHTYGVYQGSGNFGMGAQDIDTTPAFFMDGRFDRAWIAHSKVSDANLTTIYNGGNSIPYADMPSITLKAYWELDEESGNRADSVASNTLVDHASVTREAGVPNP